MGGIADVLFYSLVCIVHECTDGIHCRQSLAGPHLSILLDSSKPLVITSSEHFVLLWFSLWSVWIGAHTCEDFADWQCQRHLQQQGDLESFRLGQTRPDFTRKWRVVRYGIVCSWPIYIVWLLFGYFFIYIYKGNFMKIILALFQV